MRGLVERTIGSLLELVFPSTCVHCGEGGSLLCARCVTASQSLGDNVCRRCALPMSRPSTCSRCAASPPTSDRMIAAYQMDGPVRAAIHSLKYDGLTALAPLLGRLLGEIEPLDRIEVDLVIPVPLHPRRLRERGFNQAELLARHMASTRNLHVESNLLRRLRHTAPQVTAAGERERSASMRGAFRAMRRLHGERILLVDDVITTGSTANSAAGALKSAGAGRVTVLALAREI